MKIPYEEMTLLIGLLAANMTLDVVYAQAAYMYHS